LSLGKSAKGVGSKLRSHDNNGLEWFGGHKKGKSE